MRRGLVVAVLLCLAGAALVLLATSRAWLSVQTDVPIGLPARGVELTGSELAPGTRALALLGLAGVAALAATRSGGRIVVGALVALAGLGVMVAVARVALDQTAAALRAEPGSSLTVVVREDGGVWPYVALLGGLLLLAAGVLTVVRGRSWSALGAKYDAPTEPKPRSEASLWDALDRGEDPTAGPTVR